MDYSIDKTYTPSSHSRSQSTAWLLLSIATAPSLALRAYADTLSRLPIIEFTHSAIDGFSPPEWYGLSVCKTYFVGRVDYTPIIAYGERSLFHFQIRQQ